MSRRALPPDHRRTGPAWFGDHFQIPTVGIAVDPARIPLDNPALQALVRANQRALLTIAEQPQLAVDYIASLGGARKLSLETGIDRRGGNTARFPA